MARSHAAELVIGLALAGEERGPAEATPIGSAPILALMEAGPATQDRGLPDRSGPLHLRNALLLGVGFAALVAAVYAPALHSPFFADDDLYYVSNSYTTAPTAENLWAIIDPRSEAKRYVFNYSPALLLATTAELQLFGDAVLGYHLVNVLLHILNAVLLVALLRSSGVAPGAAALGGALFAMHPANVEAVVWISQLKSLGALAFGLGALLALWRHPAWATLLFALALLTKFHAASFLPMAAAFTWVRGERGAWPWLGLWAVVLGLVAIPQLAAFAGFPDIGDPRLADPWVRLRTTVAYGGQYLMMAATGIGVSALHEPPAAVSPLDVRWLVGLVGGGLLAVRLAVSLAQRREEAAWWVGAAAAFVPVSQWVPFRYPVADRYLYFILPGLIGGGLLFARFLRGALAARLGASPATALARAALVGAAAMGVVLALHSTNRARLWNEPFLLFVDAATQYPEGSQAHYVRAVRAAQRGDAATAVAELRAGEEKKRMSLVTSFAVDPYLAPIRGEPVFREFLRETARFRIRLARERGIVPGEEPILAAAHEALGEYDAAIAMIERALRAGDPRRDQLLAALERLRAQRRSAERGDSARRDGH